MTTKSPDRAAAAAEFDIWAKNGRGDSMAAGHLNAMTRATEGWEITDESVVVDVGCGIGWTLERLLVPGAKGYGYDISPEMIAEGSRRATPGVTLEVAPAASIPLPDASATHILNVESLYYYPDPAAALREWARVARPGCHLAMVLDLYEENPGSHSWIDALDIGVHLLSAEQCVKMAEEAGFREVTWRQVTSPNPPKPRSEFTPSTFWPSYEMYLDTHRAGSLVVEAIR